MIETYPNSRNILAGRVFLTVDVRRPISDRPKATDQAIRDGVQEVCTKQGIEFDLRQIFETPCIGGIGHNEAEDMTEEEWALAGGGGLLHAALGLAQIVE